jgi:hypothetical protein
LFAYSRHPYLDAVCTQIIQFCVMDHDIYLSFLEYMDWEELLLALAAQQSQGSLDRARSHRPYL